MLSCVPCTGLVLVFHVVTLKCTLKLKSFWGIIFSENDSDCWLYGHEPPSGKLFSLPLFFFKVFIFNYWCSFNRGTVLIMDLWIHAAGTCPKNTSFVSVCWCFLCICVIKLQISPMYLFPHKCKWTRINQIKVWIKLHFKSQYIFTAFSVKVGNSWT